MKSRCVALLLSVLVLACSSEPEEPVREYEDLSGQYEGTIASSGPGLNIDATVTATVTQEADDSLWSGTLEIEGRLDDQGAGWDYKESFSVDGTVSKGEDPKVSFSLGSLQCPGNVWSYSGEYRSAAETLAATATGEQTFWDPNDSCIPAVYLTPTITMAK